MNQQGQIPIGIVSGIVGVLGLVFGGSAYFSGIKTDIAVHENRLTTIEKIVEKQDTQNAEILKLLREMATEKSPQLKFSSTTPQAKVNLLDTQRDLLTP